MVVKRSEQSGANAPRQGTMVRQSVFGAGAFDTPAISRFPPPSFLTQTQCNLWIAALSDTPLQFFRARHIPMMIQYVRAVERMMKYSDQFEQDEEDLVSLQMYEKLMRISIRLERHLSLGTTDLIGLVVRARSEMRASNQAKTANEAGEETRNSRSGLIYVGH